MKITVNQRHRELPEGTTLETLLMLLDIKPQGIAIELNQNIIPITRHNVTFLKQDDVVEIVRMVGGG